jgi:hypothetical protein
MIMVHTPTREGIRLAIRELANQTQDRLKTVQPSDPQYQALKRQLAKLKEGLKGK